MSYPHKSLMELGVIHTGSTPLTSEASYWGGDVPFVTPAELDQNYPVTETPRTLTEAGALQSRVLRADAVMVCCIGSLGKIGIAGRDVVTNQQINSIQFDPKKIWPKYGYYACQRLKPKLLSMAPATTIPIVSKSKFGQLEIPVPPLDQQRRIADILDQAGAIRVKRREALGLMDSLTQAIFLETFGDPLRNPLGWPKKSLKDLGKVTTGRTPPSSMEGMFGGIIPFVTPGDLGSGEPIKRSLTELGGAEVAIVRAGATLVCCIGTVGKMDKFATRCAFNQQINAVEWADCINDDYGFHALGFLKTQFAARAASTTVPILNKSTFEKFELPLPPRELQQIFSEKLKTVCALRRVQLNAQLETDALFGSLQQEAFQGAI